MRKTTLDKFYSKEAAKVPHSMTERSIHISGDLGILRITQHLVDITSKSDLLDDNSGYWDGLRKKIIGRVDLELTSRDRLEDETEYVFTSEHIEPFKIKVFGDFPYYSCAPV